MLTRRSLLAAAAAPAILRGATLTPRERVDRALKGQDTDRPAFTFWYHFHVENQGGERHAAATLDFHRRFRTDVVKVMSDFPFPKPAGAWHEVKEAPNPFPQQLVALARIREGLGGRVHFVETIFNPWNVAEKLSSKEDVQRLKKEKPQALLNALEAIAKSEANHARKSVEAGASGVFLAIANAQPEFLSPQDYAKFSEPFDRMVLDAVKTAPLNTLHLHGDHVYLDRFYAGWPASVINYSTHGTGVPVAKVRARFGGLLMAGVDERNARTLSPETIRKQIAEAREAAGKKHIVTPGCSVPDDSKDEELLRITSALGA